MLVVASPAIYIATSNIFTTEATWHSILDWSYNIMSIFTVIKLVFEHKEQRRLTDVNLQISNKKVLNSVIFLDLFILGFDYLVWNEARPSYPLFQGLFSETSIGMSYTLRVLNIYSKCCFMKLTICTDHTLCFGDSITV